MPVEDNIVFAQFLPNITKGLPAVTDLVISWARQRLMSAKELVEVVRKLKEGSAILEHASAGDPAPKK